MGLHTSWSRALRSHCAALLGSAGVGRARAAVEALIVAGRTLARYLALDAGIADRRRVELEASRLALAESERRLRALALRLLGAREEKRTRLAREIHGVLGQELMALKMDAAWSARRLDEHPQDAIEPVRARLQTMIAATDNMTEVVRRIASDLRPSVLDDLGIVAAIEWYGLDFGRRSGVAVVLDLPDELNVKRELETALFRIVQELFTNIARHAAGHSIKLALRRSAGDLELRVRDDGAGITPAVAREAGSLGLAEIRERVLAFHGTFEIGACPGGGTEAIVTIPNFPPRTP